MSFIINPADPNAGGGPFGNLDPMENGDRGQLRHILIGTPQRLRASIRLLDSLRYIDSDQWMQFMRIPPDGLLIRPTPQEMYTYLQIPPRRD